MTATTRAGSATIERLRDALLGNALPGELDGFTRDEQVAAASFIADVAACRRRGELAVRLESTGGEAGRRRMRMAIINDDMPFLVDSVANAIAARQLTIHRLLHPVVCVDRDGDGTLKDIDAKCAEDERRESMMYIEIDRADARGRRELIDEIRAVLTDVGAAVRDWPVMQRQMRADATTIADSEGSALLDWFADGAMTLLGYQVERPGEEPSKTLGLFSIPGAPTDKGGAVGAIRYFEKGGAIPLIAKAERKSSVHRRVPLDLVVVPLRDGKKISGIGVHAGLWTSQALIQPTEEVPVLRRQLKNLDKAFGFDPRGHSGKALRHALGSVPRDLLINLSPDSGRDLVTMAMSLADRPRPALLLLRSILKGHMFAFVWLPRDELSTRRRTDIGHMLEVAAGRGVSSWSVEVGEGDLALIRYTLDIESDAPTPDTKVLNRQLDAMVRGWQPSVEEALIERVGPGRATRLTLGYAGQFPEAYRALTRPAEAAEDILRLQQLADDGDRDARFYRDDSDGAQQRLRLKIYRRGGLIPLSDAVPVLENFGFRVLEEIPAELHGEALSHIHDCLLELQPGVSIDDVMARAATIEQAIADVLGG
ncbi:MAG: NAD-glutamate dehydrogenase, partial [Sphingomonas bacterium]|nr:NAD-glutamate dehydrogenase [Sphingomonas bacterium]